MISDGRVGLYFGTRLSILAQLKLFMSCIIVHNLAQKNFVEPVETFIKNTRYDQEQAMMIQLFFQDAVRELHVGCEKEAVKIPSAMRQSPCRFSIDENKKWRDKKS